MRRLALLFLSFVHVSGHAASTSSSSTAGISGGSTTATVAGIRRLPRGGSTGSSSMGQFLEEQAAAAAAVDAAAASSVVYPPLSAEEIGDSLREVPLYYIERRDTGGILVAGGAEELGKSTRTNSNAERPTHRDGATTGSSGWRTRQRQQPTARRQKACYFFLEQEVARENLKQVVSSGGNSHDDGGRPGQTQPLQISTARLSQLHDKFWRSNNKQDEMDEEVDFRLVAIHQELLRARFLLTVTERDVQRQLSDEEGRRLLAKVNARPKRFKSSYNDIPLFLFPQLRIKRSRKRSSSRWPRLLVPRLPALPARQSTSMEPENDMAVPLYFTFEDMKRDLDRASRGGTDTGTCVILDLGELLQQMRKESRGFDYRNIAFVPPGKRVVGTPILLGGDSGGSSTDSNTGKKNAKYVDGGSSNKQDDGGSEEEDRVFWLRPRRRIRQQDLDALFGPDQ